MKLLSTNRPKEKWVTYFDVTLIVPFYARWVATDNNGRCCVFENKPEFNSTIGYWMDCNSGSCDKVATFYRNGVAAQDTLLEIK